MEEKPKFIKITSEDSTKQLNIEINNVNNFEFALAIMNMQAMLMKTLMEIMTVGAKASTPKDDSAYR